MDDVIRLNLADLPTMHPRIGMALLRLYAPQAVILLSEQPLAEVLTTAPTVTVDHIRQHGMPAESSRVTIGLSGVGSPEEIIQCGENVMLETVVTEHAAVCVAALMLHHLERLEILSATQKGSGANYHIECSAAGFELLEISGIRQDGTRNGTLTRGVVTKKASQVGVGLVSVTTFHHAPSDGAYSILCPTLPHAAVAKRPRRRR